MKCILKLSFLLLLLPLLASSQVTEEKPKYAPSKEKHKNKTDELGRMQGTWMFFSFSERKSGRLIM